MHLHKIRPFALLACTRATPAEAGGSCLPPTCVCAALEREAALWLSHPRQSATVACRVPNRSVRSSRATLAPTQQPRATTHSASKFAVAGMQFFHAPLIRAPAFELVIYFPRGRPLLDETLFCVCERERSRSAPRRAKGNSNVI